jgi:hypothetical protein
MLENHENEKSKERRRVIANGDSVHIPLTLMDGKGLKAASELAHQRPMAGIGGYDPALDALDDWTRDEAKFGLGMIRSDHAENIASGIESLRNLVQSRAGAIASKFVKPNEIDAVKRSIGILSAAIEVAREKLSRIRGSK